MFPNQSTTFGGQDRRKLQLKADSGVLLSSPKHGLTGQYFDLKTSHSYSKCTQVLSSPRHRKSEDELVVVYARPMKPSQLLDLQLRKQQNTKVLLERQMTQALQKQASSFSPDDGHQQQVGDSNQRKLRPLNEIEGGVKTRRSAAHAGGLPCSPISKSGHGGGGGGEWLQDQQPPRPPRHISPLKRETGLHNLTYAEARTRYKQQYPCHHPPDIATLKLQTLTTSRQIF